jgi:hypothetical protein
MITVTLPTLHTGQVAAYLAPGRFKAIRCGRRWGKTILGECVACDAAIKGKSVGIFAPDYKIMAETYHEVIDIIEPVKRSSSRIDWVIRTITGGRIDFWTLENERAGRSRGYDLVIIDEAAFAKPNMMKIWETAIQPTLLEHRGEALVLSNTNGNDPENFFWRICNQPEHGFMEYYAPSSTNPYLPMEELEELRRTRHPQVFAQEYLAEFVDWAGVQFFSEEHLLVNGQPVDMPARCDSVFAVIDTALKSGKEHDGTAASYWAFSSISPHPLICLDWDLIQVDGAVLEAWLPSVFANLERLARETRARGGSGGAHIEDTGAGTVLIQQGAARGLNVHAIDSKLTAMGKDERAFNTSGYVCQNKVKLAAPAFHKTSVFKGQSKNHFLAQVLGFRIADKKAATRADDLLDTMTYAVALALGNAEGF